MQVLWYDVVRKEWFIGKKNFFFCYVAFCSALSKTGRRK
jgi:hypothetical protein